MKDTRHCNDKLNASKLSSTLMNNAAEGIWALSSTSVACLCVGTGFQI